MTKEEFAAMFVDEDEAEDEGGRKAHPAAKEFLKFDNIEHKKSQRQDLHAFILLDELVPLVRAIPYEADMVSNAEHDQIWLGVDVDKLVEVITAEQVVDLMRCGVFYDEDNDSLTMYA